MLHHRLDVALASGKVLRTLGGAAVGHRAPYLLSALHRSVIAHGLMIGPLADGALVIHHLLLNHLLVIAASGSCSVTCSQALCIHSFGRTRACEATGLFHC